MSGSDLYLDRTILAHPQLVASLIMAAQATGRRPVYSAVDRNALIWAAAGQVLGSAYDEEEHALSYFHSAAKDRLSEIIPFNVPLGSPSAAISFLHRAESEGWLIPIDRAPDSTLLQVLLTWHSASVLDGLAQWDGTLEEFIGQPFVKVYTVTATREETNRGARALRKLGSDARRHIPLLATGVNWFETPLFHVFNEWCQDNPEDAAPIQFCGSTESYVATGHWHDLDEQLRRSLLCGLAACVDGNTDYVTLSSTTRDIATRVRRSDGRVKPILVEGGRIPRAIAALENAASTDALAFAVEQRHTFELFDQLFAPADARESVGGYVRRFAPTLMPKSMQFLFGLGRILIRRSRQ